MKYIFTGIFVVLCLATIANYFSRPGVIARKPVLYWVTDVNEAREKDIEEFHRWLKQNNYPDFEVRLDSSSRDVSKKMMQGVSGVGADILILARDEPWLLSSTGMLEDLTPYAQEHGFTPDRVWEAMEPAIEIDGQQIGFPRSVTTMAYLVNVDLFEKYDLPLPPETWTLDEFERIGREFVQAANPPGERQKVFFADLVILRVIRRSMGLSVFNETMTQSNLDHPEAASAFRLLYKWVYEDRILPSQADLDFYAGSGTVTARGQLFQQGRYALMSAGRGGLVQIRESGIKMKLKACESPYDHFRNASLGTGSVAIYKKSKHKELAAYLLEYFTSKEHNLQIIKSSLNIPPIPEYTELEDFTRPPDWPNEWGVHSFFANQMKTISIGHSVSPFVLPSTVNRIERQVQQAMLSGVYSPQEAGRIGAEQINHQIEQNVSADPSLRREYNRLVEVQKEIERLREAGELVPLDMITNPFYRKYYVFRGWASES